MKLKTKSKIRILYTLMIIFALFPIITTNNSFLKNDSNNTNADDRDKRLIPFLME